MKFGSFGHYAINLLISLDQFVNTIFWGKPDDTISARVAIDYRKGGWWGRTVCWFLNLLDKGHCEKAIYHEKIDAHSSDDLKG